MRASERDPREVKLPIWAIAKLDHLRQELANALEREHQALLDTRPDLSDVVITRHGARLPIGLGEHTTITFLDGPGGDWINGIEVRPDGNGIYVAQVSGRGLAVLPNATNALRIIGRK